MYKPPIPPDPEPNAKKRWWLIPVGVVLGLLMGWVGVHYMQELISHWHEWSWTDDVLSVLVILFLGPMGIAFCLAPLRKFRYVGTVMEILMWVPGTIVVAGHYYTLVAAPILTFTFVAGVPALIQKYLQSRGLFPPMADRAILYLALVLASLVFTYWGANLTLVVFFTDRKRRTENLTRALRPSLVRLYIYSLIAMAYLIANVEKFGSIVLLNVPLWTAYKDVLVEVLLTYAAFDAVIGMAKQWKSG